MDNKCSKNEEKTVSSSYPPRSSNVFCKFGHVYARAIVTSSTPNLKASPEYVNLARMIRKDYKGNIKIVEKQFNEKDTELF